MIWKLIRRNVAGKPFRFLLTCSAVTAGVMFVVGIFVFTDGLRETFSDLAGDIEGNVDLAVRTEVDFGGDFARPVVDVAVADTLRSLPEVAAVQPRIIDLGNTTVIDADGDAQQGNSGPNIGFNWEAETPNPRLFLVDGRPPDAPDEFAFDADSFAAGNFTALLVFTLLMGGSQGVITIVRGAVPLALFGSEGYGTVLGLIATPILIVNASAPTIFALLIGWIGWSGAEIALLICATAAWLLMEVMSLWFERTRRAAAGAG